MKALTLRPIEHRDAYNVAATRELVAWLEEALFAPLFAILDANGIQRDPARQAIRFDEFGRKVEPIDYRHNAAASAVADALESGRIHYADGVFSGKFSAAISRELREYGATFNPTAKTFSLPLSKVPETLRPAIAEAASKSAAVSKSVLETLAEAERNLGVAAAGIRVTKACDAILADLGKQLISSTGSIAPEKIGLQPQISDRVREELRNGYTDNLDLGIQKFARERIPELRARVEQNAFEFGGRTDRLAKIIEAEFGVSKRKAEFLADQETGLLVSKYRRAKYEAAGISEYIWSTSRDNRVRETHRALDGKRFAFATGANVSEPGTPARYCNPGEDWRCRCVPRPIVDLEKIAREAEAAA